MNKFIHHTTLKLIISAVVGCALLLPLGAGAQGWQRYYTGERLFALEVLPDGSLVAAGSARTGSEQPDVYWLHADAWGNLVEELVFGDQAAGEQAQALLPAAIGAGSWLLPGNLNTDSIFWARVNSTGQVTGGPEVLTDGILYSAVPDQQGGWFFCGAQKDSLASGSNTTRTLTGRVSQDGQLLWQRVDSIGLNSIGVDMTVTASGDVWVIGRMINPSPEVNYDAFLLKIDPNGAILQTKIWATPDSEAPEKITVLPNGQLLITGAVQNPSNTNLVEDDVWLAAADSTGNLLWSASVPVGGFQQVHAAAVLPNGDLVLAGESRPTLNGSRDAMLIRTDATGHLIWFKTYGGIKGDIFWDVAAMPDGGLALAGQTASFGDGTLHAWLLRTDADGNVWTNHLEGQVNIDQIEDCLVTAGEAPLANWLVSAAGDPGIFYTYTDDNGHYAMPLDTGTWYVSVLPPAGYWLPCLDSVAVELEQLGDSTTVDFPVQAAYNCPLLQVDITTPYLRRCFENTYTVRWFNYGPLTAASTQIAVLPDQWLSVTGSSTPYTVSGDTLWFYVGETPPQTGGSLTFTAVLDCENTLPGQTHCTTAWITPDSLCYAINPDWDGASLEVNGYCAGDSVVLTITNVGLGNMQNAVEFVIAEDQIIFKQAPLLLAAGADTTIVLYPNGNTVTLTVSQTQGYPGNSHPTLVIEGCGGFPFSTGYALQFPTDDGNPFVDIECRENIGSFDPNDKTGLPYGAGVQQIIEAGTDIEYPIRFQNTGTDTAFRVEIRDTLPAGLDIATLEPGAFSHPYRLAMNGSGVLSFVFDPIYLPDSTVDVAGSQGFVKYRIRTRPDLPDGTVVQNGAAIYFDFNTPVFTEKTHHQIGDPWSAFATVKDEEPQSRVWSGALMIQPNPFEENTILSWRATAGNALYHIQITGTDGRQKAHLVTTESTITLSDSKLPPGIYFLRIFTATATITNGTIIKTK